jgi:ABC-type multidrug transport system permease subunit
MDQESVMETTTTAGAGAMLTTPMWLSTINPYLQTAGVVMGILWLAMQMYYKFKNERRSK